MILRFAPLFFIGIANALPMPIMGSTLSIWLSEVGFDKSTIGLFALFGIPMSLKLLWMPLIDRFSLIPGNQRKGWIFFALSGIALSMLGMSFTDPVVSSWKLGGWIAALSACTGCLYMAGIAYELESLEEKLYPMGSANVITGYRIGLLCSGGGALLLSSVWDWPAVFQTVAFLLMCGAFFILLLPEPFKSKEVIDARKAQFSKYPSPFHWFWNETLLQPCKKFFKNPQAVLIFVFLILFKAGDELSKCMEGPFYLSLGFNKTDLATAAKTWGMAATLLGAALGGIYLKTSHSFTTLIKIGCLHASTLFCYYFMTHAGKSLPALYITVALEHLTGGLLMTAFITFLWKSCDKEYASIQYTLFWSLISFKTDLMAAFGGFLAERMEWGPFFLVISCMGMGAALLPMAFALRGRGVQSGILD
jgi:MFS transporter, PAT family, beta-lactamase induction signal transducer AmpG